MRKHKLRIFLTLLLVLCCSAVYIACDKTAEPEKGNPLVLEGIRTEIELGETVKFDEYFDFSDVDEYTLTVTAAGKQPQDLTGRSFWMPEEPGKYTIAFNVPDGEKKSTNSFELTVSVPNVKWEYTLQNKIYDTGESLVFEDFFEGMNIAADSYYPWKMVMDSVTVNKEKTEFTAEDTSYTFASDGEHVFAFHLQSDDGQRIGLTQAVRVRYVDKEMLDWMDANKIDAYNALSLKKDYSVVLSEGVADYSGSSVLPTYTRKIDSPYVAYNGEYGLNDFVVVDFTGNNMPVISMFNDEITNSYFYKDDATKAQNKGMVFANGLTFGNGIPVSAWASSVNSRYTVSGPNKAKDFGSDHNGWIRLGISTKMGMTMLGQNPDTHFRLIVGVTQKSDTTFTTAMFLLNLDTGEIIENGTSTVDCTKLTPAKDVTFDANYFKGGIALYGMFGRTTTLDKIYPIEEDMDFDRVREKYYVKSEFEPTANTFVRVGQTLNVSDYIAPENGANYKFTYSAGGGASNAISGDTFKFDKAGVYTLTYNDGENLNAQLSVTVVDADESTMNWLNTNNISGYNIGSVNGEHKVVLNKSSYSDTASNYKYPFTANASKGLADQSYVAFNGNFGLNNFVMFDFTGNNFPYVSFFDKKVDNTIFGSTAMELIPENEAVVIANGITMNTGEPFTNWAGSVNNNLIAVGPYGAFDFGGNYDSQYFRNYIAGTAGNELTLSKLSGVAAGQEKSYRVIIGCTAKTDTTLTFSVYAFDTNDKQRVVCNTSMTVSSKTPLSADFLGGNIALHGQFGKTTTIDKIYPIVTDKTLEQLISEQNDSPITVYRGTKNTENKVVLNSTAYSPTEAVKQPNGSTAGKGLTDHSYVAFNGNYGIGDFLVFDFTGNNFPYVSFFDKSVYNYVFGNSTDTGDEAVVISNGVTVNDGSSFAAWSVSGSVNTRLTVVGPYGAGDIGADRANQYFRNTINNSAGSELALTALESIAAGQEKSYRVIIGFTAGTTTGFTFSMYVIDIAAKQVVLNTTHTVSLTGGKTLSENYYGGNIALYGQFGKTTTIDKVYPIQKETTMEALISEYAPIIAYRGTLDANSKVVLNSTAYTPTQSVKHPTGSIASKGQVDHSYVVFNGNYGLNDFLVFDFTGNNFPFISFFDKKADNYLFSNSTNEIDESVVISNGVTDEAGIPFTLYSGENGVNTRLTVVGPYGASDIGNPRGNQYVADAQRTITNTNNSEIALVPLADSEKDNNAKRYRVIIGFTAGTQTGFTFSMYVIDLTDGREVLNTTHTVEWTTSVRADYYGGNIALYGQFGKTTTIDKVYPIQKDTTLAKVITDFPHTK